jgi:AcrR family transcriptional regulator
MGRPPRLSREAICDAAVALLAETGGSDFTLRELGERLGVDATAVYRHFADKDDLLWEVGDRSMAPVTRGFATTNDPADDIRRLCLRLRATLIKSPVVLPIVAAGPTRRPNELLITEVVLGALQRMGLGNESAVVAYHAIIEYTLGSAWLDAPLASQGSQRASTYRQWRKDYGSLDPNEFAATVAAAADLYPASNKVFEAGLAALISGLTASEVD